jgi:nucleoside-diphosphate-sugar epimerase
MAHRQTVGNLPGARIVAGDVTDRNGLASMLAKSGPFDCVVNCAGIASDVARTSLLMQVNHAGAANLAECVASQPLGRLVHVSTTDVYGIRDFVEADEDTPLAEDTRQGYPRSKILAERAVATSLPASRYVLLRPGAVCEKTDTTILPRVVTFLRYSPWVIHFGPWRGRNRWPLAHVRNVATAAFLAAAHEETSGQAYNVVDPTFTTVEEYYRWVLRTFLPAKQGVRSITIPVGLAWGWARASSLLSRAMGRLRPVLDPSEYALYCLASNLDFSSRKLQGLFARHGEQFVPSL